MKNGNRRKKMQTSWVQMLDRLQQAVYRCTDELAFCDAYFRYAPLSPVEDPDALLKSLSAILLSVEASLIVGVAALLDTSTDAISIPNLYKKAEDKFKHTGSADLKCATRVELLAEWKQRFDDLDLSTENARFLVVRDEIYSHKLIDSGRRTKFEQEQKMNGISLGCYGVTHGQVFDLCRKTLKLLFELLYLSGWGDAKDGSVDYARCYDRAYETHKVLLETVHSHRHQQR